MAESDKNEALDLVWEVDGIARFIGRSERQTHHMLSKGELPAKRVGRRWVAERSALKRFFAEAAA